MCRALAAEGVAVALTYRRSEATAKELSASMPGSAAIHAELTDFKSARGAVETAVEKLGGIDALVQCAGVSGKPAHYETLQRKEPSLFDIDEAEFDEMLDLTVKGTFAAVQAAAKHMTAAGGGSIVLIGSMVGVKSLPALSHYAAGKGALRAMTMTWSKELGRRGILVNLIAPGILDGGIAKALPKQHLDEYLKHCARKRLGKPEDVAQLAAWLVTQNTYVTGQTLLLDGGL